MARFLLLLASIGFASSLVAQEKPAVVFQAKSPAALLSHFREGAKIVGGKTSLEEFEEYLKDHTGEEGLQGLNLAQPVLGYARLEGKPEDTAFVLVVPITKEKDFLDLLDRMDFKVEVVEGDKGAYNLGNNPVPMHLRLSPTHAYIAFGGSAKSVAAKSLVPADDLLDPAELGLFALNLIPDRAGKEYRDGFTKALEAAARDENLGDAETKWLKGLKPMAEMLLAGTERVTLRGDFNPSTSMTALDFTVVPKKGSLASIAFAARKPSSNRYGSAAGLKDVAQILLLTFPSWSKDVSEGMASSLNDFYRTVKVLFAQGPGSALQPSLDKFFEGMASAAKSGTLDVVSLTTEPNKEGVVNAYAFRVDKPEEVEKELLALAAKIGEEDAQLAKTIQLTAAKHGGMAIHTIELGGGQAKAIQEMLGNAPKVAVACGKDTVYLALGTRAIEGVKMLIDAKPAESPAFDLQIRPQGFAKAYRSMGLMETVEQTLGTGAAPKRVMALNATSSAAALNVRMEFHLGLIPLSMQMQMGK